MDTIPTPAALVPRLRPLATPNMSGVPVRAVLAARRVLDEVLWVVVLDHRDGRAHTVEHGSVPAGPGSDERLAAAIILSIAQHTRGRHVSALACHPGILRGMGDLGDLVPRVLMCTVRRGSELSAATGVVKASRRLDVLEQQALGPGGGVRVATDASIARFGKVAGIAWVRSDGKWWTGTTRASSINVAELEAVHRALRGHQRYSGQVEVLSDSRAAIAWAGQALQGLPRSGPELREAWDGLSELRMARKPRLKWVRAHAGNRLNLVADRLAVLARRHQEAGIDPAQTRQIARQVISEHLLEPEPMAA